MKLRALDPASIASGALTGSVHLWSIDLDCSDVAFATCRAQLSEDEQERADRFATALLRRRWITARGTLRMILASYLGCPGRALRFVTLGDGKPLLADPHAALHFNLSHSGATALVAASRVGPVGVDIECHRDADLNAIAADNFAAQECAALAALPPERQRAAFFDYWTCKEALSKAVGQGIWRGLQRFELRGDQGTRVAIDRQADRHAPDWWLEELHAPGMSGALAMRAARMPVVRREFRFERDE